MKQGDKIIWDSGFGFEVGFYTKDKGVMYNTCQINLVTGVAEGELSIPEYEVSHFTKENIETLIKKYERFSMFSNRNYQTLLDRLNIRHETI